MLTPLQLMNHNRTVSGVNIGRLWGEIAVLREELQAVLALWDQGKIRPRIDAFTPSPKRRPPIAGHPATAEHRQDPAHPLSRDQRRCPAGSRGTAVVAMRLAAGARVGELQVAVGARRAAR